MYKQLFLVTFLLLSVVSWSQNNKSHLIIPFDNDNNTTSTFSEIRQFYRDISQYQQWIQVNDFGMTDSGFPLQEVILAADGTFSPEASRKAGKAVLFINNGIHPGEPEGIDASMILCREVLTNTQLQSLLKEVTLVIIPVYNIGGCINRGSFYRSGQNGPESYGFRGNAINRDLNRDFIKCDTKNALSFNQLFNKWYPDVLLDNHSSNGADYQHSMTIISTHKDRLQPTLSHFMTTLFTPYLYREMAKKGWDMIPYVMSDGPPETGLYGFIDSPRYSSGYAALHHTISFMPETHMLKPYKDRVASTLDFIKTTLDFTVENKDDILSLKQQAIEESMVQDSFSLNFKINLEQPDSVYFRGYASKYKKSLVSGLDRLYYDKTEPWEKYIPFVDNYEPVTTIKKPKAYIIPQGYSSIIDLMKINGVQFERLTSDTLIDVEMYRISGFETVKSPYEGHYMHYKTEVKPQNIKKLFYKGDFIVNTHQKSVRYIVETLEPQADDSWFAWNFFDGILSQKEYFSDYIFEDIAAELLDKNPELRKKLDKKRDIDADFAKNARAQLDFVYKNSKYHESTFRLYPVARIVDSN